jgi:hypothetical protein
MHAIALLVAVVVVCSSRFPQQHPSEFHSTDSSSCVRRRNFRKSSTGKSLQPLHVASRFGSVVPEEVTGRNDRVAESVSTDCCRTAQSLKHLISRADIPAADSSSVHFASISISSSHTLIVGRDRYPREHSVIQTAAALTVSGFSNCAVRRLVRICLLRHLSSLAVAMEISVLRARK